ncbi:MAG: peptidoglycan-binding domain-containing protein [Candidatus Nanopelagicales bacterium]
MVLVAQRFAGSPTLQKCVTAGYRVLAGEPDTDAVRRIQASLGNVGYPCGTIDGAFGNNTGTAVSAFKRDMALSPTDPVVGSGTMTALDGLFDWEPADPDLPDPTTVDLVALAQDTITNVLVPWLRTTVDALAVGLDGLPHPGDPGWVSAQSALDRNFRLDLQPAARLANMTDIHTVLDACLRLLDPGGFLHFEPMDRVTFAAHYTAGGGLGTPIYVCSEGLDGGRVVITPPFRNTLDDEDRAVHILRFALRVVRPSLVTTIYPGTRPWDIMNTATRLGSRTAYQSFVVEVGNDVSSTFRNAPLWM